MSDYRINQNPYSFFESNAKSTGSDFVKRGSWASQFMGGQVPEFDGREVVSVWVKNRDRVVHQKNYLSLAEFQAESLKYKSRVPLSKTHMAFTINRVNSITNFVTDLLFPLTAELHRSYYSGRIMNWISPEDMVIEFLSSVLIDVATIFARVITLPYRLATVKIKGSHPLFKEVKGEDNVLDDNLMVFITAQVNTPLGKRVTKLAYPLFLSNMNEYVYRIAYEKKIYCSSESINGKRSSSSKPNDRRSERNSSQPKVSENPTDAAFKFFCMNAKNSWEDITKKYKKLALTCHPDKCLDPEAQMRFTTLGNHFDVLKKHYKQN